MEEKGRKGRVLLLREGKEGEERERGEWKGRGLAPPEKFLAPPLTAVDCNETTSYVAAHESYVLSM